MAVSALLCVCHHFWHINWQAGQRVFSQNLEGYEDIRVCSSVLCTYYCSTNWFADRWKEVTFIRFTEFSPVQAMLMTTYCFRHLLALLFRDWLRLLPSNNNLCHVCVIFHTLQCEGKNEQSSGLVEAYTGGAETRSKGKKKVMNWELKGDQCVRGNILKTCCFGIV